MATPKKKNAPNMMDNVIMSMSYPMKWNISNIDSKDGWRFGYWYTKPSHQIQEAFLLCVFSIFLINLNNEINT